MDLSFSLIAGFLRSAASDVELPPAVVVQPRYTRSNTWLTLTIIEGKANQDGRENSIESKLKLMTIAQFPCMIALFARINSPSLGNESMYS
ncbi:hypothetical protein M9H77_34827 [Catharanthus roseus]|uniref:Uncharacterized protein n=1 Tax=Catharanthus roseus TaxID=4058 RepID=A0ACB9ZPF5_CATRO|nr:hypothetical protein M9H77_34827 [Catharanthus roseus]